MDSLTRLANPVREADARLTVTRSILRHVGLNPSSTKRASRPNRLRANLQNPGKQVPGFEGDVLAESLFINGAEWKAGRNTATRATGLDHGGKPFYMAKDCTNDSGKTLRSKSREQ